MRYYRVLSIYFLSLYQAPLKKPKKLYTFRCPMALRATISFFSCFIEFVFIMVESCCWFGFMFLVLVLGSIHLVVPLT
jgi:hypothetical protein